MAITLQFMMQFLLFFFVPVSSQVDQLLYAGFKNISPKNLTLNGFAEIEKNGIIRLTNESSRLMGHAFYPLPFQLKNKTTGKVFSFSSSFALTLVPKYPKLGGHGMAFTIAPSKDLKALPSHVGNFSNNLFAVEFGYINDNHVGIDINSLLSNASVTADYYTNDSTKQDLNIKSGKPTLVWVDYDSSKNVVSVTISPNSTKPKKPILSYHMDLSPILHDTMYVGFSASTGLLACSHYVLGWSFRINGPAPFLDLSKLPQLRQPKKKHTSLMTGVSVVASVIALCSVAFGICVFRKFKNTDVIEAWGLELGLHRYSYRELKKATKDFAEEQLLGRSHYGKVYKGTLPKSNIQIAVKRVSNPVYGAEEFVSEIASIGHLRHQNLVALLGWCRFRGDLLLVYDFMANGSLKKYLFEDTEFVLSWEQRFKIIKDVASGLLYLHEGYEQVVIHGDVKPSNVLLDFELNGRLGDFAYAKLHDHGSNPRTSTEVVGTYGYLAPEIFRTGIASASSDVYEFGMLLLMVACGKMPSLPKPLHEEELMLLVDWVWERFKEGRMFEVVDPKLNGDFHESVLEFMMPILNHKS